MKARIASAFACAAMVAGCSTAPRPPQAAAEPGPRGFIAASPPADNSFTPLRCVPNGPGFDCSRKP